jgi:GAF domain-containing protein
MSAPTPPNEAGRLAALREYYILDTAAEQAFEDIAALAAFVCDVPIALISFVDEARQWFKSRIGISEQETPRDVAFCAYTIMQPAPLIVDDACADARFENSKLVTNEPRIRFYAGFPLISHTGFALGALCAVDRTPRHISARQQNAMQRLSRQVMALLELRRLSARMAKTLETMECLRGLLLVCFVCQRVRDPQGHWLPPEAFLRRHLEAKVSPGICPDCFGKEHWHVE